MTKLKGTRGSGHTAHKTKRERVFLPRGIPLYKPYRVCAAPKGRVFVPFCLIKGIDFIPILVWNRVWFSNELHESMNLFIVLAPNE